jgi:tRNA(Ile)-lysidine synthase
VPAGELIDAARVARFRADLERLTGYAPRADRRLLVAVSGGPDSLALLLLARTAYAGAVIAATVDHGLRAASRAEAESVARVCGSLGIEHVILEPSGTFGFRNMLEAARAGRYGALSWWASGWSPDLVGQRRAEWIALGHQQDDVAETFLARAARGSGVVGLAAMAALRHEDGSTSPSIIRPLLRWSRAELRAIVDASGITPVADPSNDDPRFDRSRYRRLIAATPDLPSHRLARAAQNLREADDALEWYVVQQLRVRFGRNQLEDLWLDPGDLPRELRRRFLIRAIDSVREENGNFEEWDPRGVDRLLSTLDAGRPGTLAGVHAQVIGDRWCFTLAPPPRTVPPPG